MAIRKENAFYMFRERYHYDNELGLGWHQYDTDQDAYYFGVWTNSELLRIITFAEGDETKTFCDTTEEFSKELAEMSKFYGEPPPAFKAISMSGEVTCYFDERDT